jgi:hypothetical protein
MSPGALTRPFEMFVFQKTPEPPRRTRNQQYQEAQSLTEFTRESIVTLRVRLGEGIANLFNFPRIRYQHCWAALSRLPSSIIFLFS